jgi:hypothetical protein
MRSEVSFVSRRQLSAGRKCSVILGVYLLVIIGCGGNPISSPGGDGQTQGDFSILLSPSAITIVQGTSQNVSIQVSSINGFVGTVQITVSDLPSGISAAPLSVDLGSGTGTCTLRLSATTSAAITSTVVTAQATSGSLKHSAALTLETSVRSAAFPFTTVGGGVLRGYYDAQRQLLFTSNFFLNEVDVVSAIDLSVIQRISVPQPIGLDQMPDGKTLVVGTMTQSLYLVDEDSFVARSVPIPNLSTVSTTASLGPVAMANGKVLFIGQDIGGSFVNYFLEGWIYEWNPANNTFVAAPLSVGPTGPIVTNHLARSGDHKFAIFNQYGGGVYVYSSDTDAFININNGSYAGDVAANADGSQFAESISGAINFYDQKLNLVGSVTLTPRPGIAELASFYGMQYSPDGSFLYVQVTDGYLSPVAVIDPKQFKEMGMVPTYFGNPNNPAYLLAADNANSVYLAAEGGVGRVTCSKPVSTIAQYQVAPLTAEPDSAPLNTAATVTFRAFNIPAGTTVTIGGVPGTLQTNSSGELVISMPVSSVPGPADIVFSMPDGTVFIFPQDFSCGLTATSLSSTLAPDRVPVTVSLYGFGLVASSQSPSIYFGSTPATTVDISGYGVTQNSLERILVTTPASSPGTVDVMVNSTNGTSMLKAALTYVHTTIVPSAAGLSSLLFDSHRNLLYATRTNASQVYVFDPAILQWKTSLQVPGAAPGASYNFITETSDGSKLIAVDSMNAVVTVFSPDNPASGQSLSLRNSTVPNAPPANQLPFLKANSLAVTSTGKVFVNMVGWYPAEIDLHTMTLMSFRNDTGVFGGPEAFRNSSDGSHFVSGSVGNTRGGVSVWDPATDTFHAQAYQRFWSDLAISNDGKTIAAIDIYQLGPGDVTYFIDDQLHYVNTPAYPDLASPQTRAAPGVQFSPQGKVYVLPRLDCIDFIDVATGKLRARYAAPEPILTPQNVADVQDALAIDSTGQTIFSISSSGLTVIQLSAPIDNLPQAVWPL